MVTLSRLSLSILSMYCVTRFIFCCWFSYQMVNLLLGWIYHLLYFSEEEDGEVLADLCWPIVGLGCCLVLSLGRVSEPWMLVILSLQKLYSSSGVICCLSIQLRMQMWPPNLSHCFSNPAIQLLTSYFDCLNRFSSICCELIAGFNPLLARVTNDFDLLILFSTLLLLPYTLKLLSSYSLIIVSIRTS